MNDRDVIRILQSTKNSPKIGGDFDVQKAWSRFALENDFPVESSNVKYAFRDYVEFYVWQLSHAMVKPLAAGFAVVVFMMAGWIGMTNASFDSLPGDRLYPVKLSMEKLQLAAAIDPSQRSRLELEFTSRRLNEMVELTAERNLANPIRVRMAVDRFKDNVSSLSTELTQNDSTELAKAVGRKTQVYRSAVQASPADVPQEVAEQVAEVQELIDTTEDQAVDVIITAHENQEDAEASGELKIAFESQLAQLDVKQNAELMAKREQAIALAAEGSYRRAFQLLKEIELLLKQTESAS